MLEFLLSAGMRPFSIALGLVAALALLELVLALVGLSAFGEGDGDLDLDGADLGGADLGGADLDAPDLDIEAELALALDGELDAPVAAQSGIHGASVLSWLGIGQTPFLIWLAGTLTAFGLTGYGLQLATTSLTGGLLPAIIAAALALVPGLLIGRWFARLMGRLLPRTESSAVTRRRLGGRVGVLAQGTARAGQPAQARIKDRHGNTHYVRVVPFEDDAEIAQGEDVIVLTGSGDIFRAIRLSDAETLLQQRRSP
ncbi:MAG: OB-fold-containig protein [Pseudomonadota bacterium]